MSKFQQSSSSNSNWYCCNLYILSIVNSIVTYSLTVDVFELSISHFSWTQTRVWFIQVLTHSVIYLKANYTWLFQCLFLKTNIHDNNIKYCTWLFKCFFLKTNIHDHNIYSCACLSDKKSILIVTNKITHQNFSHLTSFDAWNIEYDKLNNTSPKKTTTTELMLEKCVIFQVKLRTLHGKTMLCIYWLQGFSCNIRCSIIIQTGALLWLTIVALFSTTENNRCLFQNLEIFLEKFN